MRGNGERVLTCGGLITNTGMYVYVYYYVCMDVCGIESIRQNGMLTRGGAPLSETRPEAACAYCKRGGLFESADSRMARVLGYIIVFSEELGTQRAYLRIA